MTTKPIYHKIKIHFLFYMVAFLSVITGLFKPFFLFFSLILIHECGHIMVALYYGWNIEKVILLPFGGLTLFKEKLNRPWKEEFLILLFGPFVQLLFYFLITLLGGKDPLLTFFHWTLLAFNLLPILPLDGSKLVELLLERFLPYRTSTAIVLFLSLTMIVVIGVSLFFNPYYLLGYLILLFLLLKTLSLWKDRKSSFQKFLLERFLYSFSFPRKKRIKGEKLEKMYRDCYHYFIISGKIVEESEILHKKFDFKRKL